MLAGQLTKPSNGRNYCSITVRKRHAFRLNEQLLNGNVWAGGLVSDQKQLRAIQPARCMAAEQGKRCCWRLSNQTVRARLADGVVTRPGRWRVIHRNIAKMVLTFFTNRAILLVTQTRYHLAEAAGMTSKRTFTRHKSENLWRERSCTPTIQQVVGAAEVLRFSALCL